MAFYMASNGSCFTVIWTIYNNHLLEVGLTQIRETKTLQTPTTIGLLAPFVGQRLCINFSVPRANFLTTLRLHLDVTCSYYFWSSLFNVDVDYSYTYLVNCSCSLNVLEKSS